MEYLKYRRATMQDRAALEDWLIDRALEHDKPTFLLQLASERLHWERILRAGLTTLERVVSTARQRARKVTYDHMAHLLTRQGKQFLDELLEVEEGAHHTLLAWLQQIPTDHTAIQINTTLDKIRFLQEAGVAEWELENINPNRLKFLANIGARASNQQLKRTSTLRRYPTLVAFLKQTLFDLTDIAIDLFDANLWERHTNAKAELDEMRLRAARSTNEKLRTYKNVVSIVMDDTVPEAALRSTIFTRYRRRQLQQIVQETESLNRPKHDEAIDFFAKRYGYIRRFASTILGTLTFRAQKQAMPLLKAIELLKTLDAAGTRAVPQDAPTDFISNAWWEYVINGKGNLSRRYYELAVLWELRLALRSGDIHIEHSRRYADPSTYLIPPDSWLEQRPEVVRLTRTPADGSTRLQEREAELRSLAERVEQLHVDRQSGLRREKGKWVLSPLEDEGRPVSAQALEDAIVARLPRLDITDLLIEVDNWTRFSRCLGHASSGLPTQTEEDLQHLYASLLAQGCNFSLAQMSRSSRLSQHRLSLYGAKAIASTVRDATYVLDVILANETELPILEHTTDTNGYTEIVFALFDLLGLTFTPRIRDLADLQLYRTENIDLDDLPRVRARLSKRVNVQLCLEMWDEMLRLVGSLKLGWVTASLVIQKIQAAARKSQLAKALQEYGRLIKTLHALGWYESEEKRKWSNRQLNKGESVHTLKAHLIVANRGAIGRKTEERLQHQVGCHNLLTNAVILWNSVYMAEALVHLSVNSHQVCRGDPCGRLRLGRHEACPYKPDRDFWSVVLGQLEREGHIIDHKDLMHVWPTRFEHINVYGRYHFNLEEARQRNGLRELRQPDALDP